MKYPLVMLVADWSSHMPSRLEHLLAHFGVVNPVQPAADISWANAYLDNRANPLPSLIIIDSRLEGLLTLWHKLCEPAYSKVPIIVLLEKSEDEQIIRKTGRGYTGFMSQAVENGDLAKALQEADVRFIIDLPEN